MLEDLEHPTTMEQVADVHLGQLKVVYALVPLVCKSIHHGIGLWGQGRDNIRLGHSPPEEDLRVGLAKEKERPGHLSCQEVVQPRVESNQGDRVDEVTSLARVAPDLELEAMAAYLFEVSWLPEPKSLLLVISAVIVSEGKSVDTRHSEERMRMHVVMA